MSSMSTSWEMSILHSSLTLLALLAEATKKKIKIEKVRVTFRATAAHKGKYVLLDSQMDIPLELDTRGTTEKEG